MVMGFGRVNIGQNHMAAAPSETSEQSVRFNGPATIGFFSLSSRQNSNGISLRICAYGLPIPLECALEAIMARGIGLVAIFFKIKMGNFAKNTCKTCWCIAIFWQIGGFQQVVANFT